MNCPNCGTAHNSNFCPNCGTQQSTPVSGNLCPRCNAQMEGDVCGYCNYTATQQAEQRTITIAAVMANCTITGEAITITPKMGASTVIPITDLSAINHRPPTKMINGNLDFLTATGLKKSIIVKASQGASFEEGLSYLHQLRPDVPMNGNISSTQQTAQTTVPGPSVVVVQQPVQQQPASAFRGVKCPKCKGHNIQMTGTSQKKVSKGKMGAALMTGGASLLLTGVKGKEKLDVFCMDCGKRFQIKS